MGLRENNTSINTLVSELNGAIDQNLNYICIMKTIKCHQLNLMSGGFEHHTVYMVGIPDIDPEELQRVLK